MPAMNDKTVVDRTPLAPSSSENSIPKTGIPRIPLNLRAHKTALAITAVLLVSFSGVLPVILYYILKDGANTSDEVAITVSSVVFGAYSIIPLFTRIWKLAKKNSTVRPLGATGKHLDWFQLNFITLFCLITGLIAGGSSLAGSTNQSLHKTALKIVSMSLSILMIAVCGQMVILFIAMSIKPTARYPWRISSMTRDDVLRPACYSIAEDVVAVDGKQGTEFRRLLNERYMFSDDIKALFKWADGAWGFTGVLLGAVLIIVIWVVPNQNVGFVLGWIVPWIWASTFTLFTVKRTELACRQENSRYAVNQS